MSIYHTRVAPDLTPEERSKLVFDEVENLEKTLERKIKKIKRWSIFFAFLNTSLNLVTIISAAVVVILSSIYTSQNIPSIVLSSLIIIIAGVNELLKLGPRGYYYRHNNVRLNRILGHIRNIIFMYHTYSIEQVLTFLSSFRAEIDELDLDLYKSSLPDDKYTKEIENLEPVKHDSESHIHIHIDTSSSGTPNDSPYNTPRMDNIRIDNVRTDNTRADISRSVSLPLPTHQKVERKVSDPTYNRDEKLD